MQSYLNITDLAAGAILVYGMIVGIKRGLSGELIRIFMIGLSIFAGWTFASTGAAWLGDHVEWPSGQRMTASFFGLIILAYVATLIIRLGMRFLVDFSFKGKLEIIGGAVVGLLRSALLCSAIILGLLMTGFEPLVNAISTSNAGSLVTRYVQPHYEKLAEENPEFNFPESPEAVTGAVELPDSSEYLGPITDEGQPTGSDE